MTNVGVGKMKEVVVKSGDGIGMDGNGGKQPDGVRGTRGSLNKYEANLATESPGTMSERPAQVDEEALRHQKGWC